ncbi:MAG: mechanosensitive ion channel protein MscS [Pseudomonadota bacterium]
MKLRLIWPILLLAVLPLAASWFAYPDTHLPPGFGVFPPLFVAQPPGFNGVVFVLLALVEAAIALFLIFPRWFGFKGADPAPMPTPARLPLWFWIGAAMTAFFWWLMWARVTPFGDLVYYAFTPLWWGFILTLDGLVYRRSGGYSLLASRPVTFLISVVVSVVGWFFFEYFDYFALGNWYYPNSTLPELSHATVVILFLVAYTTVWPAIFEWYTLLNTFPKFVARYANGPKLALPGKLLMWTGLALVTAMVFFPYPLFWAMWVGVLAVFAGLLIRLGIPTPFTAMAQGNWGPMILMALSAMFNGFFWELWNWGSAHPAQPVTNPNYWVYDVPYVNVIHIFAEMPLLGYFGYLPFGLLAWVMFIWAGRVFGFDTALLKGERKTTSGD